MPPELLGTGSKELERGNGRLKRLVESSYCKRKLAYCVTIN